MAILASHLPPDDGLEEPAVVPGGVTFNHLVGGLVIALQERLFDLNKIHLKGRKRGQKKEGGRELGREGEGRREGEGEREEWREGWWNGGRS